MIRIIQASAVALTASASVAVACPTSHFNAAHEAAQLALGTEYGPRFAYLPPDLLERDDRAAAIDDACHLVARELLDSAKQPDQWGMASDDGKSGIELLRCIAGVVGATGLPLLELAYVGQRAQEPEARALVEQWGARFRFVTDPGEAVPPTLQAFVDKHCPSDPAPM